MAKQGPAPRKASREPARPKLEVRQARLADVKGIYACQAAAYPSFTPAGLNNERLLRMQLRAFPEGQFVAVEGKRIVGYATSLIVQMDEESPWYSYAEITGQGTFSSHDPSGDTLYGADIAVHPDHRGKAIAGMLYAARRRLLKRFNLRRFVAGGRIPGYRPLAGQMTAEQYVEKVVAGELKDMALNAHLKAGFTVRGVHMGYLRDDQSLDYATFLEMENPDFRPARRRIAAAPLRRPMRKVRICAAQYEMRRISSWEEFENQVDFFVKTAEDYDCHLLLLPELFTVQLFATLPEGTSGVDSIKWLADQTPRYLALFERLAKRSGLLIAAGTHPVHSPTGIRNVAHLFSPSGNVYTQDKLHVTPNERREYGIVPGSGLQVFDTGCGRIGLVVCYDIEFPELARLLTLAGAELLLVPFTTDERKAYLRVRYSAHARAVENTVYVAMSGNVGNLPRVENFLINYAESAILTPSDFAFPAGGIAALADPNNETVVITDLDLGALDQARQHGAVQPLRDRRADLYEVVTHATVEKIRVV
jgi:predicted amidohydrolase/ribosomal protein S18 acetylase RimI-like enzyme